MAITLDFKGDTTNLIAGIRESKRELAEMSNVYKDINNTAKRSTNSAGAAQKKLTGNIKKSNNELEKEKRIIKNIETYITRLKKAQRDAWKPGDIKKYNTEIARAELAIKTIKTHGIKGLEKINDVAAKGTGVFGKLGTSIKSAFLPLLAAGAVIAITKQIISLTADYEQQVANLSAITGAVGDDLEYLKTQAIAAGIETTRSASETVEAYKLIASAKPELLGSGKALAAFTRDAITLSEAMGADLPTAAANLTDIMNQFNAPAEESGRYINVLAAGAKYGAAEIGDLAESMKIAGTDARTSAVSIEEVGAAAEYIATKGLKGAEAGTKLRNVFIKLSATDILPKDAKNRLERAGVDMEKLSDKTLSFSERLKALKPIQDDANALTAVFGAENKSAAINLIQGAEAIDTLREKMTGSNVAQEQAAIRTRTLKGEFRRLVNVIQSLVIENGGGLTALLTLFVVFVRKGVLFLRDAIKAISPAFSEFTRSIRDIFSPLKKLVILQGDAGEKTSLWKAAIEYLLLPLRVLLKGMGVAARVVGAFVAAFVNYVNTSPKILSAMFALKVAISGALEVISNFPAYLDGAAAAVGAWVRQVIEGFRRLGEDIGDILFEAFNLKKLFTKGTGDLKAVLQRAVINPFSGAGSKAAAAFNKAFFKNIKEAKVPSVKTDSPKPTTPLTPTPPTPPTPPTSQADEKKLKEIAKLRLEAIIDAEKKEIALEEFKYKNLVAKLKKYNIDTQAATLEHEKRVYAIKSKYIQKTADLDNKIGKVRAKYIYDKTIKEINALEKALKKASGGKLIDTQIKQLNLLRRKAAESYANTLSELNSKEIKAAEAHEIALLESKRAGFKNEADFEKYKSRELINIKIKYLEKTLKIQEALQGANSTDVINLKNAIAKLKRDLAGINIKVASHKFSIYELIGLDASSEEDKKIIAGIEAAEKEAYNVISQIADIRLQAAENDIKLHEEALQRIDDEIRAKESKLKKEEELAKKGYNNQAKQVKDEIKLLQERRKKEDEERKKALEEKAKAQKLQFAIDTVAQGSSLITAAANIFSSVSAIPVVGVPLAIGLIATMIGAFISAKSQIYSSIKAEKGITGIARGKRHSGGGIRFVDEVEIEDGEAYGVLSRRATRKHGSKYIELSTAINSGNESDIAAVAQKFINRHDSHRNTIVVNASKQSNIIAAHDPNVARMQKEGNEIMKDIRDKESELITYKDGIQIIKKGNKTRIIK